MYRQLAHTPRCFVGTAGILTYGSANILNGIWFGRKLVADVVDGIAYGLVTGAICLALAGGGCCSSRLGSIAATTLRSESREIPFGDECRHPAPFD